MKSTAILALLVATGIAAPVAKPNFDGSAYILPEFKLQKANAKQSTLWVV